MASKFKKYIEKPLCLFLVLSIVAGVAYFPTQKTKKAEAILGIGDITVTVNEVVRAIIDGVAMGIAQRMIDEMVNSTIDWAQSGFDGSPAFVEKPGAFLGDIANQEAGRYLNELAGTNLCSPFKPQIVLSLGEYYRSRIGLNSDYSCTFTDIGGNFQAFLDGDFSQGGWDSWFQLTQNPSNNPYEVYLNAQSELDAKIASKVGIETTKLNWGQGFRDTQECLEYNSYIPDDDYYGSGVEDNNPPPIDSSLAGSPGMKLKDENKGPNECIDYGKTKTPATIIKGQLDKVLPSGLEKLISVEHIEGLVSSLATGLLNRYVFSSKGLSSKSPGGMSKEFFDQDKDGIPDGYDYDQDGNIDACLHGLKDPTQGPSNNNCVMSKDAQSSSFFIPICENLQSTIHELEKYYQFLIGNSFDKKKVRTWQDKTIAASGASDNLINILMRHEVDSSKKYEPMLFYIGKYAKYLDEIIDTLIKDEDLGDKGFLGTGAGGTSDSDKEREMERNTLKVITYLKARQAEIVGDCQNPDTSAWERAPAADIEDSAGTGGTTGGAPDLSTANTRLTLGSSCNSDKTTAGVGEVVGWDLIVSDVTGAPVPTNYYYQYTWGWGTTEYDALNQTNIRTGQLSPDNTSTLSLSYPSPGNQYAAVTVLVTNSPTYDPQTQAGLVASFTKACNYTNTGAQAILQPVVITSGSGTPTN